MLESLKFAGWCYSMTYVGKKKYGVQNMWIANEMRERERDYIIIY